jgi:hypothetical protein
MPANFRLPKFRVGNGNTTSPAQGNQVVFYHDIKYTGMSRSFSPGNFTNGSLGNRPIIALYLDLDSRGNMVNFPTGTFKSLGVNVAETIPSLTVAPSYAVQVFRKPNLKGRSQIFTTSINDLRRVGRDYQMASIYVSRVN